MTVLNFASRFFISSHIVRAGPMVSVQEKTSGGVDL